MRMNLNAKILTMWVIFPACQSFNMQQPYNAVPDFQGDEKELKPLITIDDPMTTHDLFDEFEETLESSLIALHEFDPGMKENEMVLAKNNEDTSALSKYDKPIETSEMFDNVDLVSVQGGSQRTCSVDHGVERVTILMKTEGRPLNANVDLWHGPENTPQKMTVYLEDGCKRPFRAIVETPGSSNSIAIRNTGQMEFPLSAGIEVDMKSQPEKKYDESKYKVVQGGSVHTARFASAVQSVRLSLKTHGRPLDARVEILQGPNNNKQVMEVYTEDGLERPFNVVIDTPGNGNVVRVLNTAGMAFPLSASIEPYYVKEIAKGKPSMSWSHDPINEVNLSNGCDAPPKPKNEVSNIESLRRSKESINSKVSTDPAGHEIISYLDDLFEPSNSKNLEMVTSYLKSLSGTSNYDTLDLVNESIDTLFGVVSTGVNGNKSQNKSYQDLHGDILSSLSSIQERLSASVCEKSTAMAQIAMLEAKLAEDRKRIKFDLDQKISESQTNFNEARRRDIMKAKNLSNSLKAEVEIHEALQSELRSLILSLQSSSERI